MRIPWFRFVPAIGLAAVLAWGAAAEEPLPLRVQPLKQPIGKVKTTSVSTFPMPRP